jgi:hypothetical protein
VADALITVAGVSVTAGVKQNSVRWTVNLASCLPYLALAVFEVWAAASNDRNAASKIADTTDLNYVHTGLLIGVPRYYWVRAKDASGQYSDFFPLSTTSGVVGVPTSTGTNSVGYDELKPDSVDFVHLRVNAVHADNIDVDKLSAISADMTGLSVAKLSSLSSDLGDITAGNASFAGGKIVINGAAGQIVISD